jgi:hypothetical protein
MMSSPRAPSSSSRPRTQPLAHRLSLADSLVIVGALAFASFLCVRDVPPHIAVIVAVGAVSTLMLVVVVPRGVVEVVGLLRELVQVRGELVHQRGEEG